MEGNIGSGKSHFLQILSSFGYNIVQESLEMWDFSATPAKGLLSSYFDLSDRYSPENLQYMVGAHYFFQAYYLNKISGSIFQERSIFSCKDVFLPELNVDSAAKERILRFLTALADRAPQPDFVIYLNTPPPIMLGKNTK